MDYKDKIILSDVASCSVSQKDDFVELLQQSGIPASLSQTPEQLVEVYVENVGTNKELLIGSAYLCAFNTSSVSFNGDKAVQNDNVHDIGRRLYDYFDMGSQLPSDEQPDEEHSEIAPFLALGVQGAKKLFNKFSKGGDKGGSGGGSGGGVLGGAKDYIKRQQDDKYRAKYGTLDLLEKKQEAKNLMIQQVMAQKAAQQQAELKKAEIAAKTKRTYIVVGSIVAGLLLTTGVIIYARSRR